MATPITRRPTSSRAPTAAVLFVVTAGCWGYLFLLRSEMGDMLDMGQMTAMGGRRSVFAMPMTAAWSVSDAVLMWTMWAVMMAAMMIPSATPMIQAYNTAIAPASRSTSRSGSTPLFVAGYLSAWSGFAAAAAAAQWALRDAALVDAMGASTSRLTAGPVLVLAGVYQFSSLKNVCLGKCRSPLGFLLTSWRGGNGGAFVMGLHHGTLCIGCCWALMALLFVLGVMNLWWIAFVATVVLIEKVTRNVAVPRALGVVLVAWGLVVLLGLVDTGVSA